MNGGTATRPRAMVGRCGLGIAALVALAGCATVIVERDDDVEASSAAGGSEGGGAPATGPGGSGVPTSATSGGPAGTGGSPATGSSSTGGGGAGGAEPRCTALAWGEPGTDTLLGENTWDDWVESDGVRLRHGAAAGAVEAVFSGRTRAWGDVGPRKFVAAPVVDAWAGAPRFSTPAKTDFSTQRMTPYFVAAPSEGVTWWVGADHPYDIATQRLWLARLEPGAEGWKKTIMPSELGWLRDLLVLPGAPRTFVFVSGTSTLDLSTSVDDPQAVTLGARVACGDRELPVDLEPIDGRPLLVFADGGPACGPPTTLRAAWADGGAASVVSSADLAAPVRWVQVVRSGDTTWIAARTEGSDRLTLLRLGESGAIEHSAEVALASDRDVTVASWSAGLAIVDSGGDGVETPWVHVRVTDDVGLVVAESSAPGSSFAPDAVAALESPTGGALLVSFLARVEDGRVLQGLMRADCVWE